MEHLQSRPHILKLIRNVSEACGIKNSEIRNVKTNPKGMGFLGEIFFVTIDDQVSKKQLDLVIKAAFKDEKVREFVPIRESFENEIFAYTTMFPKFDKFLKSKGLDCDHYQFVPKCYRVSTEHQSEIVILENLRTRGFDLLDKRSNVDGDHLALIFKTYGHLHGISLALKDQHPDEYEELADKLLDNFTKFMENQKFVEDLKYLIKLVDNYFVNGQDDTLRIAYQKYITDGEHILRECLDSKCKNSVILHGDCWNNNRMFKYDITSRKPIDIRLFDLQLMKVGNPVCDLSYCLYLGASKEHLDKLDDYLSIYYQALSDIVRRLGSEPKRLLSFDDLKNDWKQYAKFGFLITLCVYKLKMSNDEDVMDFTDQAATEGFLPIKFDEKHYGSMAVDILRHMYAYGVL